MLRYEYSLLCLLLLSMNMVPGETFDTPGLGGSIVSPPKTYAVIPQLDTLVAKRIKPPVCRTPSTGLRSCVSSCDLTRVGMDAPAPVSREQCFPPWLNLNKFKLGQKCIMDNWKGSELGEAANVVGLLAIPSLANVLLFTTLNDCPSSSNKRYITTMGNIRLWATVDIETKAGTDAVLLSTKKVREVHIRMGERVRKISKLHNGTLQNQAQTRNLSLHKSVWAAMKRDMKAAYTPNQLRLSSCYKAGLKKYRFVNQFEYAMTQWSAVYYFIPPMSKLLLPNASSKDLEAASHFTAVICWLLGIDDRFNIGLQAEQGGYIKYYEELLTKYVIPLLYNIDTISKHLVEWTLERITAYPQALLKMPDAFSIDGYLMIMLRLTLGIPYANLYKVASTSGRSAIDAMEAYLTLTSKLAVNEPYIKGTPDPVHDAWGIKTFGTCYNKWNTEMAKAKYLHYVYQGPDLNPFGIHSNCSQTTKCYKF